MTDRIAEQGAVQYAQENPVSSGVSRLGAAGSLQAAIADALSGGRSSLNGSRLGGNGRIYALAASAGPMFLFQNSEQGVWYDPSDFSTMFQDDAGTTPVTAVGDPVGKILDKSGRGNHATQSTSTARPVLQQDSNGRYYLAFDGTDDFLVTSAINFTATDKMSVFAGVRKLSDAAGGCIAELSASIAANQGGFLLVSGALLTTDRQNFAAQLSGTAVNYTEMRTYASPFTAVLTATHNIGATGTANENSARINGGSATTTNNSVTDAGTGNFGNYPLYIGMRGGASLPFNGRLYSLIVRGALADAAQIAAAEAYVNSKTAAY